MISVVSVSKTYSCGEAAVHALRDVTLEVARGDYVAIRGASGSGKSTLLNLIALLDVPTEGKVVFRGVDMSRRTERERARIRNSELGIVFQRFNLVPQLTAWQNVALPGKYGRVAARDARRRSFNLLASVGLSGREEHRPSELSGGEEQRVAIARALFMSPNVLLADEPTGNLDSAAGAGVMELLETIHGRCGTLFVVTHDPAVGGRATRTVEIHDGRVTSDSRAT
jgi:putative ABC transport system ATP-binding protein